MPGTFITVPGVNPPTTRARVDLVDAMLPDAGALLLLDPTHPYAAWSAGVPATGEPLVNIAAKQSNALTGVTTTTGATLATADPDAKITLERSGRGGLHGIVDQTAAIGNGVYSRLDIDPAIATYMGANPGNSYYISRISSTTRRTAGAGGGTPVFDLIVAENTAIYLIDFYGDTAKTDSYPAADLGSTGFGATAGLPALGAPKREAAAAAGFTGTPTSPSAVAALAHIWGSSAPVTASVGFLHPSSILYRIYIEDLTVSGRTYGEVAALEAAEFAALCTDSSGRYYGDTYTAPN
jgi:hypothetical protein